MNPFKMQKPLILGMLITLSSNEIMFCNRTGNKVLNEGCENNC